MIALDLSFATIKILKTCELLLTLNKFVIFLTLKLISTAEISLVNFCFFAHFLIKETNPPPLAKID